MTSALILHASCVAVAGKGVLITGPSGSGKSALALQLMAYGATLVADDRTAVHLRQGQIIAMPPATIQGMIEARFVGLLHVPNAQEAPVTLVVDMEQVETQRLPEPHSTTVLDIPLPCLQKVNAPYFPAAILAYLQGDRKEVR
ncbi:HPr kinase/phosphatase C-terminal domain-containing protein [Sulfitobacter sp. HNIBRBA2951]|uniref:HPr kinase/phosphorylase n=1 Tax=Sulfitobacter aquimarinus TaxID=3158557 RepID=UPI0032DEECE2